MRLDQMFSRAGFEILSANKVEKTLVMDVRVPMVATIPSRWMVMLESILVLHEGLKKRGVMRWDIDVNKNFYSRGGSVRYIWRIKMSGDLAACQLALVNATKDALRVGNELHEVRLVGQVNMTPDPANGKWKGAVPRSDNDQASQMIASAFIPSSS